jgi:hypothetical protein
MIKKKKLQVKNYKIIFSWYSNHAKHPVERFIFLWIMFNHWYKNKYKELKDSKDRTYIDAFKEDYNTFHSFFPEHRR